MQEYGSFCEMSLWTGTALPSALIFAIYFYKVIFFLNFADYKALRPLIV